MTTEVSGRTWEELVLLFCSGTGTYLYYETLGYLAGNSPDAAAARPHQILFTARTTTSFPEEKCFHFTLFILPRLLALS